MFTGLIEAVGVVEEVSPDGSGGQWLHIRDPFPTPPALGDSIAIGGVCLTVVRIRDGLLSFQCGPETLDRSTLGSLSAGGAVNLERSLRVGDRLGGHFVQGHVDGIGRIESIEPSGEWRTIRFSCPADMTALMVQKGSIAVDGISLTLVDVREAGFDVMLIPHTLSMTTLGLRTPGDRVNLEADMLAKHVRKLLGR